MRAYSHGLVASALSAALTVGLATAAGPAAGAAGAGGSTSAEAALQVQAQELAGEIEADGRNLDRIAETLDAAQIRSQQLTTHLGALRATVAKTTAQVTTARTALREQAVISYVAGGSALTTNVPDRLGSDPSVTVSYAEIVAGGQRRAVAAYRAVLARPDPRVEAGCPRQRSGRPDRRRTAQRPSRRRRRPGRPTGGPGAGPGAADRPRRPGRGCSGAGGAGRGAGHAGAPGPAPASCDGGRLCGSTRCEEARPVTLAAAPTGRRPRRPAVGSTSASGAPAASASTRPASTPAPTRPVRRSTAAPRQTTAPHPTPGPRQAPAPTATRPPSTPRRQHLVHGLPRRPRPHGRCEPPRRRPHHEPPPHPGRPPHLR